jgi:BlaI family transcriptional regulator, penicillinase repressor
MKRKIAKLGDLQLRIMKILWLRTEATVTEVLGDLTGPSDLAYTTVATMLRKMEAKGLVAHRIEGRSFIYRARVKEEEVTRTMADHFVERLFEGSLTEVVSHLLSTREVSKDELETLERLIAVRKNGV